MEWFDESRLEDESVLSRFDSVLRSHAESGARVRRAAGIADDALREAVARTEPDVRPRAILAVGPDSRLLRAVLEPWCPVPFVAWPNPQLPAWVGSLDMVVVLAPHDADAATAAGVAEAVRRGCQLVVAGPAKSMVAEHATGRWASLLPVEGADPLATAVVMLDYLSRVALGPRADAEDVASALDAVAISCSPHADLATNPAKMLAISLADATPLVWGDTVLAARAARRVAESMRRSTGRPAVAGDAEHLLPILEATPSRDVFADPFADGARVARPALVILDDGAQDPVVRQQRGELISSAEARGVRVEIISAEQSPSEVAHYASLVLHGRYAATYLQIGLTEGERS